MYHQVVGRDNDHRDDMIVKSIRQRQGYTALQRRSKHFYQGYYLVCFKSRPLETAY